MNYLTLKIPKGVERMKEFAKILYHDRLNPNLVSVPTNKSEIILQNEDFQSKLTFRLKTDKSNKVSFSFIFQATMLVVSIF